MQVLFFVIAIAIIALFIYTTRKRSTPLPQPASGIEKDILQKHVLFYQRLNDPEKSDFENRVHRFLEKVRITGVKTELEDRDRIFVAAGAIIPIFAFKDWEYRNIHEVLIYPGSFSEEFQIDGQDRNVLGLVGNGPLQNVMILSQQELRNDFLNAHGKSNTAVHEFVHLVDKTDGSADGLPEALLPHKYAIPWLKRIHEEIGLIRAGRSDINPYGATNEAEFLAVAAEYFFEQPQLMHQKHPELYDLLKQAFAP
jgi:Mlc titration factor MtfA (ptsG expression regulator)